MNIRSFISASMILASLPLVACGGGDDDTTEATNAWAGHTYTLTTTKRDWAKPASLAADIERVMPIFMFEMASAGGGKVNATIGTAPKLDPNGDPVTSVVQDPCGPTLTVPVAGTYPASQIGPTDMQLHLKNYGDADDPTDDVQVTATVRDLEFTNLFPNGSTPSMDGTLSATMDFRELAPLFLALATPGMPPTADGVCSQLSGDTACQPCFDGQPYCLSAQAVFLAAVDQPGMSVAPVTEAGRAPSCE